MVIKNIHPKLSHSVQTMIIDSSTGLPYYGEFNLYVNFYHKENIGTCAVNVTEKGMNFYYSESFLDKLTQKQVNFIVLHEDFHLLFNHVKRTVSGNFDRKLSNIVQDMIINHIIWQDISHDFVDIPKNENGEIMALFVPKDYNGKLVFEELYEWMRDKKDEHEKNKKGQESSDDQGDDQSGQGQNAKDPLDEMGTLENPSLEEIFDSLEETDGSYLDKHIEDDISEEVREGMVQNIMDRLESRGLVTGDVSDTLGKLIKKRKDYLKEIKKSVSNIIFGSNKTKTITRPNRRQIKGLKGNKKIKSKINVILDVSGSMSGLMERVLSYVYRNDIEINMIQADTEVKSFEVIKSKKKLDFMDINGLGGTRLMPAVDFISQSKLNKYNTVILTDGYTDELSLSELKGSVLIITTGVECGIQSMPNKRFKQIVVEK